ncbi:MAG TPA: SDR family NAD(P)-dependent oxidoreductase [Chthoniobacterales bacterium]
MLNRNNSTFTAQRYTSRLNLEETVLRDHRVNGRPVLPGAASLELALAGATLACEGAQVRLREVAWVRPIVGGADGVALELELRSQDDGQVRFNLCDAATGVVHALGLAERRPGLWIEEHLDFAQIRVRCVERVKPEPLYERLARAGLEYGKGFQVIQEAGWGVGEVWACLELPGVWTSETDGYRMHPALVDGALQTLSLLAKPGRALELPFTVESVECARPLPKTCYAFGKLESHAGDGHRYSLRLADEHGEVLARLDGLSLRPFEGLVPVKPESAKTFYARPVWRAEPALAPGKLDGAVLLLDDDAALSESLSLAGVSVMRVAGGERYKRCGNQVQLRRNQPEDYQRLVREVSFGAVIHHWSGPAGSLDEALDRGLYSVHLLVQALMKAGRPMPLVYAYPGESAACAAMTGYARSLAQEQPELRLKVVGLEEDVTGARELLAELSPFKGTPEVRYRAGRREVRLLDDVREEWNGPLPAPSLRRGGVFLISGGAGGLGRIFTEYLTETYDARVVLAGRSDRNASNSPPWWDRLGADRVSYVQADVSTVEGARRAVREAKERYGVLHGVIHAAGLLRDALLWRKGRDDFEVVLSPKVRGVEALDEATSQQALDCFILFSSTAALWGNAGQGDYAYANAYLDAFAHRRESQRQVGLRSGRTLSLNWPLWADGGMEGKLEGTRAAVLGLRPLARSAGLEIFERALASADVQVCGWVAAGRFQKEGPLPGESTRDLAVPLSSEPAAVPKPAPAPATSVARRQTVNYLVRHFAALTKMDPAQVRPSEPLERYGFDSILAVEFSQRLSVDLGELSKTLLFEYSTLNALADHLLEHHAPRMAGMWPSETGLPAAVPDPGEVLPAPGPAPVAFFGLTRDEARAEEDIAIIGLAGRYPQADDVEAFWANLVAGKDCIQEIPPERWDYRLYFDAEPGQPGRSYNKWGGFLQGVDKFDALFFNISPREAAILDPQERLFLEVVWNTVENSGYSRRALTGRKVGVYVGVMYGQYQLFGVEETLRRGTVTTLSSSYASIANRVSYFFDWRGPSLAIDTMCSSALMSIHLACESLKRGETELAVAGGVNLILHPHKDVGLSQAGFLNEEGRCRSFAKVAGRGYIAGEGVGAVLLKPLSAAVRDRDNIQGVIKGAAVNHNGKTNGYTAPSPKAQAEVVAEVMRKAGVSARSITYLEAAATGSALGDPIEVDALGKAFHRDTRDTQFCALGSVKSNIGHLESASGIAGLTKVLLQLRHRQLAPSIHTAELNPDIRWEATPFVVQRALATWQPAMVDGKRCPRRAGISAFGAAGSNAHLIVEEFCEEPRIPGALASPFPVLILLSAKDALGLNSRAAALAAWLQAALADPSETPPHLIDVAYTLQIGREPMDERFAFQAETVAQALEQLTAFPGAGSRKGWHRGNVAHPPVGADLKDELIPSSSLDRLPPGELDRLAVSWSQGIDCRWEQLYTGFEPRRLALPGYSFARERCWFRDDLPSPNRNGYPLSTNGHVPCQEPGNDDNGGSEPAMGAVREILGKALGIAPARLGARQPFTEVGLDSVTMAGVVNEFRRVFGTGVSARDLLEHPTLESFVAFLQQGSRKASGAACKTLAPAANGAVTLKKERRELALAPVDYLFARRREYTIQVLFYFERHLDFARLRSGLRQVSEAFYPVNARLVRHGKNKYRLRECTDEPDFEEFICGPDVPVPDQERPETFQPFEVGLEPQLPSEKMARFRLFQLPNGSLLSVNVSHAIADGYSFYFFLSSWAAACRGEVVPSPSHARNILRQMARRYKAGKHGRNPMDLKGRGSLFSMLDAGDNEPTRRMETIWLDAAAVLAGARREAAPALRDKLTENGVITAWVWQTYARSLPSTVGDLSLACPIDFRRLSPKLSPSFFGNAVAPALLRCPYEQVVNDSVAGLAAMISEAVRQCDHRTLMAYNAAADSLRRSEGLDALRRAALIDPRNGLIVTNVARFPLPPVDFGTGPFTRELTPVNYPGTAVIVAGTDSTVKVRLAYPESAVSNDTRDVH